MVGISEAIQVLYPNAVPLRDFEVTSQKGVSTITYWDASLGPQPTQAQLDAVTQTQVDAARDAKEASTQPEYHSLKTAATQAITDINTFLALNSPTNAQTLEFVRTLGRQNRVIIRRLIQIK